MSCTWKQMLAQSQLFFASIVNCGGRSLSDEDLQTSADKTETIRMTLISQRVTENMSSCDLGEAIF